MTRSKHRAVATAELLVDYSLMQFKLNYSSASFLNLTVLQRFRRRKETTKLTQMTFYMGLCEPDGVVKLRKQ